MKSRTTGSFSYGGQDRKQVSKGADLSTLCEEELQSYKAAMSQKFKQGFKLNFGQVALQGSSPRPRAEGDQAPTSRTATAWRTLWRKRPVFRSKMMV